MKSCGVRQVRVCQLPSSVLQNGEEYTVVSDYVETAITIGHNASIQQTLNPEWYTPQHGTIIDERRPAFVKETFRPEAADYQPQHLIFVGTGNLVGLARPGLYLEPVVTLGGSSAGGEGGAGVEAEHGSDNPSYGKYRLLSAVVHIGMQSSGASSTSAGHYIAIVAAQNGRYTVYNDSNVESYGSAVQVEQKYNENLSRMGTTVSVQTAIYVHASSYEPQLVPHCGFRNPRVRDCFISSSIIALAAMGDRVWGWNDNGF